MTVNFLKVSVLYDIGHIWRRERKELLRPRNRRSRTCRPERNVLGVTGCLVLRIVGDDDPSILRIADYRRRLCVLVLVKPEPHTERRIGHALLRDVHQPGVLVRGADTFIFVHLCERAMGEERRARVAVRHREIGRRELENLDGREYPVDTAAQFLAHAHAAHE